MSEINVRPLAFHITFGTYGTRLHGDERGTIDRKANRPGDPIVGSDASWWSQERGRMKFPPVVLTLEQMRHAEQSVPYVCTRGEWTLRTCAAGPDHVHVLLTAMCLHPEPERIRMWLKRWLGQAMSKRWSLPEGATWWAEGGCIRYVWSEEYYEAVHKYERDQRAAPP
ncbi:MAG TPA: hypothetical protein VF796_07725 [Humisphaera sp.]